MSLESIGGNETDGETSRKPQELSAMTESTRLHRIQLASDYYVSRHAIYAALRHQQGPEVIEQIDQRIWEFEVDTEDTRLLINTGLSSAFIKYEEAVTSDLYDTKTRVSEDAMFGIHWEVRGLDRHLSLGLSLIYRGDEGQLVAGGTIIDTETFHEGDFGLTEDHIAPLEECADRKIYPYKSSE